MAQAGIIKTITGSVNARTPDGQIRELMAGDMVYENEIIETSAGSQVTIELSDGKTLALAENNQVVLDETVISVVDPKDAVVAESQELQAALEAGEDIPEEEPAAGEEDEAHDYDLSYYAGDQSRGEVDSYLFGTEYGGEDEDFPDIEGEEEDPAVFEEEEGPEPLFILGSNPDPGNPWPYGDGEYQEEFPYPDDIENPYEDDSHTVNPAGANVQGAIIGQDGADTLVGDPGGVEENLDNNYILVMDTSRSMRSTDGGPTTRLADLQQATKDIIQEFYDKVDSSTDGSKVKINLLPFSSAAGDSAWISFTKSGDTVIIDNSLDDGDSSTNDLDEIYNWIEALTASGGTNYTDAFTVADTLVDTAYDQNDVLFISDGMPSAGGDYNSALTTLEGDVNSIRVVGINMDAAGKATLDDIVYPDGEATNLEDAGALSDVISGLVTDLDLLPTGSDEIYGNDGDDLIFGDVLNTDNVFDHLTSEGYDLTDITELPDGSGWTVFETLESELSGWTREDTIQYIQNNHEELAEETVLDGESRDGGHDYIEGGAGNDIIYGQEGDDVIDAGSGDDVVDGGTGFDTLIVTNETELDFSNVSNIERLHMDEDGVDQNITISLNEVLNMTDEDNRLYITGQYGDSDSVTLTGVGTADGEWSQDPANENVFTLNGTGTDPVTNPLVQVTIADWSNNVHVDVDDPTATDFDV